MKHSAWHEMKLGEFLTLQRGHDLTDGERRAGSVPVFGSAGMNGTHDTALAKGPGVVVGRSGASFGQVHFSPTDFWPHNTSLYVKDFRGNDPRFTYYLLKSIDFSGYNSGSAQPSLNRNFVYPIVIEAPRPEVQRTIARVLGTMDDKIELNWRMNRTLEELAAALFRSWFVDFDPVVAKAASSAPFGLAPKVAALFSATFTDSELGSIPKGWRTGKVAQLASMSRGGINPADFPAEVFDHYSLPAFDDGRQPQPEFGNTIKSNKFPVPAASVLVSKLNPHTPRVWMPELSGERRAICSTEFLVMTPKSPFTRQFLRCLFSSDGFSGEFATFVTGTSGSHQRVKPESLLGMDAIIPPAQLIERFTETVRPWLAQSAHNIRESHTLAALRDTLLPKLLSGELRVKDAEKKIATVV